MGKIPETTLILLSKTENEFEVLPILFESDETVLTYFWVDNFNVKVEKIGGTSAVNTTHLMAFQEKPSTFESSPFNEPLMNIPSFERSGEKKLSKKRDLKTHPFYNVSSNPKPPKFTKENSNFGTNFEKNHHGLFVQDLFPLRRLPLRRPPITPISHYANLQITFLR